MTVTSELNVLWNISLVQLFYLISGQGRRSQFMVTGGNVFFSLPKLLLHPFWRPLFQDSLGKLVWKCKTCLDLNEARDDGLLDAVASAGWLSVLWRCWLGGRKGIRPVKNWVVGCWHGYVDRYHTSTSSLNFYRPNQQCRSTECHKSSSEIDGVGNCIGNCSWSGGIEGFLVHHLFVWL